MLPRLAAVILMIAVILAATAAVILAGDVNVTDSRWWCANPHYHNHGPGTPCHQHLPSNHPHRMQPTPPPPANDDEEEQSPTRPQVNDSLDDIEVFNITRSTTPWTTSIDLDDIPAATKSDLFHNWDDPDCKTLGWISIDGQKITYHYIDC